MIGMRAFFPGQDSSSPRRTLSKNAVLPQKQVFRYGIGRPARLICYSLFEFKFWVVSYAKVCVSKKKNFGQSCAIFPCPTVF